VGDSETIRNHAAFIWSVADLLRGDYKQSEYGKVVLPLTVIRRLDCVLEPTKQAVLERHKQLAGRIENLEPVLQAVAGQQFYNTSPLTFEEQWVADDELSDQAKSNRIENFRLVFERKFMPTIIGRMDANSDIFKRILDDDDFRELLGDYYVKKVYEQLRDAA
jgi:type I restriction-modification system DNA methylase subunit